MLAYKISSSTPDERDAAVLEFRAAAAEARRVALRGARAVIELERTGAHLRLGASSIAHFAEMNGLSAWEARQWSSLGLAIARRLSDEPPPDGPPAADASPASALARLEASLGPCLEAEIVAGTIPVASAAVLGELVAAHEALAPAAVPILKPDDEWVLWARTRSTREFRRLFARRRDEVRAGEGVVSLTAFVTYGVREDLERARTLASRNAHAMLTLGQTLGIVVDDWLADHDPLAKTSGPRRLPDTSTLPGRRYVPAEVDREVRRRSRDACIVPLCDRSIWVHRSHRVAHRDGGSREADQLDLLCDWHHYLYEDGDIRITGPTEAPIVTDRYGREIDKRKPWEFGVADPPPGIEKPSRAPPRGGSLPKPDAASPPAAP